MSPDACFASQPRVAGHTQLPYWASSVIWAAHYVVLQEAQHKLGSVNDLACQMARHSLNAMPGQAVIWVNMMQSYRWLKMHNCNTGQAVLPGLTRCSAAGKYVLKCLLSPDVRQLATASADKTVKLWNLDGFTLERTLTGTSPPICDPCLAYMQSTFSC